MGKLLIIFLRFIQPHIYIRKENIRKCIFCGREQMRDIMIYNDYRKGIHLIYKWKNIPKGWYHL
jgi:hypothetical protein